MQVRGFRVRRLVLATTLTDARRYPQAEMARLFRARWHVELDLRSIKATLHMDDLRCKSPEMVRREILVHWLAYNLIRKLMAQAALREGRLPRELSFAAAVAAIGAAWDHATIASRDTLTALAKTQWRLIAWHVVGHRPNRVEPRRSNAAPRRTSCSASPARRRGQNCSTPLRIAVRQTLRDTLNAAARRCRWGEHFSVPCHPTLAGSALER